jgi:hypothetical protein
LIASADSIRKRKSPVLRTGLFFLVGRSLWGTVLAKERVKHAAGGIVISNFVAGTPMQKNNIIGNSKHRAGEGFRHRQSQGIGGTGIVRPVVGQICSTETSAALT